MWRHGRPLWVVVLALAAVGLEWLRFRHVTRINSDRNLSRDPRRRFHRARHVGRSQADGGAARAGFVRNEAAIRSLGLRPRMRDHRPARLRPVQQGAGPDLGISPNTVKTHVARVYEKLEVQNRMQAVEKARWLALIP